MKLGMEHEREVDEDEKSSSECSSGCQSGWTMYLDHSSDNGAVSMVSDDDGAHLSMVSDASSGPPHFPNEHCGNGCCSCSSAASSLPPCSWNHGGKKRRVDAQQHEHRSAKQAPHSSLLDDTASSPLFAFPKTSLNAAAAAASKKTLFVDDVLELSCGSSATQFKLQAPIRHISEKSLARKLPNSIDVYGSTQHRTSEDP